eukprot:7240006-Karenia_brevis.AAC.1
MAGGQSKSCSSVVPNGTHAPPTILGGRARRKSYECGAITNPYKHELHGCAIMLAFLITDNKECAITVRFSLFAQKMAGGQ